MASNGRSACSRVSRAARRSTCRWPCGVRPVQPRSPPTIPATLHVTHPQTVTRVAAGSSGAWLATGCADGGTRLIDAVTGAVVFSVEGDGAVRALAFAPAGTVLATANEDGTVVLVDAATATEFGRVTRLFGCAKIALSAGGELLVTAWDDGTVVVGVAGVAEDSAGERAVRFGDPVGRR